MKLSEVFEELETERAGGDGPAKKRKIPSLDAVQKELAALQLAQDRSQSDSGYWAYVSEISYREALRDLLKAAEIVGPDNLPDFPIPRRDGMLMDNAHALKQFGANVLTDVQAKQTQRGGSQGTAVSPQSSPSAPAPNRDLPGL